MKSPNSKLFKKRFESPTTEQINQTEKTIGAHKKNDDESSDGPLDYHVGDNEKFYDGPSDSESIHEAEDQVIEIPNYEIKLNTNNTRSFELSNIMLASSNHNLQSLMIENQSKLLTSMSHSQNSTQQMPTRNSNPRAKR